MSVQTNQYLMYGISLPFEFSKEWESKNEGKDFYETFEGFMNDSSFNKKINHKDGIFCLFDGMNGKFLIIGRVIEKGSDDEPFIADGKPICFTEPTPIEKEFIANSIERNFGVTGELKHWLVTKYS